MHSRSDNKKIMINDIAEEIVEELLQPLVFRYQIELETSMKGILKEFVFDYVHLLYYKCHKINMNRRGSNVDFSD